MFLKRIFDFVVSLFGLIILFPLLIIVGVLIKFDSKGPILYRSKRIGKDKKDFILYKFRTMKVNSDFSYITVGDADERITRLGFYLRKYKIDELPQLINVLVGDLSFVGPRPDVPKYKHYYEKLFPDYFSIRPGITSYASIYFRDESEIYLNADNPEEVYILSTIPQKVELDKKYYSQINLKTDIQIIFKTILVILKPEKD